MQKIRKVQGILQALVTEFLTYHTGFQTSKKLILRTFQHIKDHKTLGYVQSCLMSSNFRLKQRFLGHRQSSQSLSNKIKQVHQSKRNQRSQNKLEPNKRGSISKRAFQARVRRLHPKEEMYQRRYIWVSRALTLYCFTAIALRQSTRGYQVNHIPVKGSSTYRSIHNVY